jgi:hypothetical protein
MRFIRRISLVVALGCAAAAVGPVGSAVAASPSNDTFAGATVISSVPYSVTEDTTGATLDAADTAAGNACGIGALQFSASVWFAYTPTSDQTLSLGTSGSSYPVGVAVLTGSPASFSATSCSFGSAQFQVNAGTTYYFDLAEQGANLNGGTLQFSLVAQAPPTATLTVDNFGKFNELSGSATISGTATCSAGVFAALEGSLGTTPHGRLASISGFGFPSEQPVCDGTAHPWSFVVTPASGLFKGGPATADVSMFACSFSCVFPQVTQTITLNQSS